MRYWFDTEFIERGSEYPIELLSIGIVAEDGREFYAEAKWTPLSHANDWVVARVLPYLDRKDHSQEVHENCPLMSRTDMAQAIKIFCDPQYGKPEFWAYYADYDWVVFCQLFGTMMDLPEGWPMYCRDIKQWADDIEVVKRELGTEPNYKLRLPEQGKGEHYALADARWNRQAWEYLRSLEWL
jgi:hypothetical protein